MQKGLQYVRGLVVTFLLLSSFGAVSAKNIEKCFVAAAKKHGVPMKILLAVSYTESRFKSKARNSNRNGTRDYGLMQINSIWASHAKKLGFSWQHIKSDPCTNVMFGSYILRQNYKRMGSWKGAIGAYNAGFGKTPKARKRRLHYYRLVMKHREVAQRHFKKSRKKLKRAS